MRALRDDRGAVSILVALLISAGVIVGLLAMVIDGGRLYTERRLVQNGADAAALAVARACALGDPACSSRSEAAAVVGSYPAVATPSVTTTRTRETPSDRGRIPLLSRKTWFWSSVSPVDV